MISISDEGLISELKNNNKKVFREIYNRYWAKLYLYAFNILKDKDICEDIIQQIFTDIWVRREKLTIKNLQAFLYGAVRRQIAYHLRGIKITVEHEEYFANVLLDKKIEEKLEFDEFSNKIQELIQELPEQRRKIFLMSRFENLSNQEIADKLDISLQTVKNQISTSLKYLRESLKMMFTIFPL